MTLEKEAKNNPGEGREQRRKEKATAPHNSLIWSVKYIISCSTNRPPGFWLVQKMTFLCCSLSTGKAHATAAQFNSSGDV